MGVESVIKKQFEEKTGLTIENFLEHRTIQWGSEEITNLFVFKVKGKRHPAFATFEPNDMKKWGFIIPCTRSGLKNDTYD